MSQYSDTINKFMTDVKVGDVLYVEVETQEDQSKTHRSISVYASKFDIKVTCKNFMAFSHDFKEIIPMVRISVLEVKGA